MGKKMWITKDDSANGGLVQFLKKVKKGVFERKGNVVVVIAVAPNEKGTSVLEFEPDRIKKNRVLKASALKIALDNCINKMTPEELDQLYKKPQPQEA